MQCNIKQDSLNCICYGHQNCASKDDAHHLAHGSLLKFWLMFQLYVNCPFMQVVSYNTIILCT